MSFNTCTQTPLSDADHTRCSRKIILPENLTGKGGKIFLWTHARERGCIFLRILYLLPPPAKILRGHNFLVIVDMRRALSGDFCCIHSATARPDLKPVYSTLIIRTYYATIVKKTILYHFNKMSSTRNRIKKLGKQCRFVVSPPMLFICRGPIDLHIINKVVKIFWFFFKFDVNRRKNHVSDGVFQLNHA